MHTTRRIILATGALAALTLAGCNSARYVDSKGTDTIVSLNQIDIQDWNAAADKLVSDLLASGALDNAPTKPAVMAVSRIINNTNSQVDTDLLTKNIRTALLKSGKVITTTTIAYGGSEDPLAKELGGQTGTGTQPKQVYYTLSGKLIETGASAGSTKQVTYTFQLSLTTVQDGLAVWENQEQITKQGKRAAVGW